MLDVLFEDSTTRLEFIDRKTDIVFICFNSLGMNESHLLDFYSLSNTFSIAFVTDKTSSWGNDISWNPISKIINDLIKNKESYSIGVSMGGTNSIISSNYLDTNTVISFNPQYTIHPDIFPDSEYRPYAEKITDWKHITIKDSFNNNKKYYNFVSCKDTTDVMFIKEYPEYIFDCGNKFGHNLAFDLKNAGLLNELLSLITSGPEVIKEFINTKVRVDKKKDLL